MKTLLNAHIPTAVAFDATNSEHKVAYWMIKEKRRQHPTLRFILEEPFKNVPEMMTAKMAAANIANPEVPLWLQAKPAPYVGYIG